MNQAQESKSESKTLQPRPRDAYHYFAPVTTRWSDNDAYGHINNVVFHEFVDTVINRHLLENGVLDILGSTVIGLVKENRCVYFESIAFPDQVDVGLKVTHIGNSSVCYEVGIFRHGDAISAVAGHFVHIYVDRASARPTRIPEPVRRALEPLRG